MGWAVLVAIGLTAGSGWAEQDPMLLDRCNLEMVDCATGPGTNCLVGPTKLDDACMERCQRAFEKCMSEGERKAPRPRPTAR